MNLVILIVLWSPLQDETPLKSSWPQLLEAWKSVEKYRPQVGRAGLDDTFLKAAVQLHDALKSSGLLAEKGEYAPRALKCFLTLCLGRVLSFPEGLEPIDELDGIDSATEPDSESVPIRALLHAIHHSRNFRLADAREKHEYDRLMSAASKSMKTLRIASAATPPVLEARALVLIRATVLGHPYPEHEKPSDVNLARVKRQISDLGGDEIAAREAAMKALAEAGDGALPLIRGALMSLDSEVQARARLLLGFGHEPWTTGGREVRRAIYLEAGQKAEIPWDK